MKTLKPALALWKQRLTDTLAEAKGTRWDVFATRVCGLLGAVAGVGVYAHWIPGKPGAVVAGTSAVAAALLPRATKAAGLLSAAYGQKTPFFKVVPQLLTALLSGPSIVAEVKAEQQAQAEADKQQAVSAQVDQAVEKKIASLTFEDFANITSEFASGQLGKKAPDVPADKALDVPEAAEERAPATETPPEAETTLSTPGSEPAIPQDSVLITGGNQ